jgi:hypothetical protein
VTIESASVAKRAGKTWSKPVEAARRSMPVADAWRGSDMTMIFVEPEQR